MSIDIKTPESRGWWVQRLSKDLHDPKRLARLKLLDDWFNCEPPLPAGYGGARDSIKAFHRHTRSAFAALIPEAVRERMRPDGVQTSSDGDSTGDAEAWRLWRRARLSLVQADVHRLMLRFGVAYALASPVDPATGAPVATAEDPRYVVSEQDPLQPWKTIAGLKMFRDPVRGQDLAFLYRPGRLDVAFRDTQRAHKTNTPRFAAETWAWDEERSGDLPDGLMPLQRFANLDELAEFEPHLDLLARINYMVLQRMTIATLQAFKQRAVKGVPVTDKDGRRIDYNDIFSADPGALWLLPATAEMWESGQVDMRGVLESTKADVQHLAAVSRTTLSMFAPEGENQSAEGAASAKEGLIFKCEDRIDRVTPCWSAFMQSCFILQADALRRAGKIEEAAAAMKRADLNGIDIIWAAPQRASLMERANALAAAKAGEVPFRTRMIEFGGFSPERVTEMESEREDELFFAARLAGVQAVASGPVTPTEEPSPAEDPAPEAA